MPYITVGKENSGNIELYYEDHGSGQPVVLIHGYPLSGASWEKQVPVLLEAGYRVITMTAEASASPASPTTGYNYDTFAEDVHQLIAQLKLRDFTLVGFSMGGGEVARYIGKYGSKGVSKAVIISSVVPYLLKSGDNPEGLDASVFAGIENAVAADRYAFFTSFFQNFYNTDLLLVSGSANKQSRLTGTWRPPPPPPRAWRVSQRGTKTSARTWNGLMCQSSSSMATTTTSFRSLPPAPAPPK